MKISHIAAAAVAVFAINAQAQSISSTAAVAGAYQAITFDAPTQATVETDSLYGVRLAPLFATGSYSLIAKGDTATLTFAAGVTSYTFLWGSPDDFNHVTAFETSGSATFTGFNLVAAPSGINSDTKLVTISADAGQSLKSLSFASGGTAFELAAVTPVPEPETYALMLAGLGAIGFVARRRKAA